MAFGMVANIVVARFTPVLNISFDRASRLLHGLYDWRNLTVAGFGA